MQYPRPRADAPRLASTLRRLGACAAAALLFACGGGGGGGSSAVGSAVQPNGGAGGGQASAAALASRMGLPQRFLSGLGTGNAEGSVRAQGLRPDLYDAYLAGVGGGAWPEWNSPRGAYVNVHAARADSVGAVPVFTLYQMAANGDGNLAGLTNNAFMAQYWDHVRLMFQRLAIYDKPAFVVVEPDFWGYVMLQAPGGNPTAMPASVTIDGDCAGQPDNVSGVAGCVLQMARKYAPKAAIGFMPSSWGGSTSAVASFMRQVGAHNADFLAMETLDRDAGCFEAQAAGCTRAGSGWYWSDADFRNHLAMAASWHQSLGLPLLWWQTPMGVPSGTPGGSNGQWRDNRVQWFLTHADEMVAAGGLGAVFSTGANGQTNIDSDGGQYKRLSEAYLASPAPLP